MKKQDQIGIIIASISIVIILTFTIYYVVKQNKKAPEDPKHEDPKPEVNTYVKKYTAWKKQTKQT